jgi:ABC-type antimicrobial peptide transport system permease subunit
MSSSAPKKTPFLNFLAFMFAFGWEGPVIFSIGLRNNSTIEMLIGLLFTIFFWALFGIRLASDLVKHLLKWKSPDDALATKPAAKSD